MCHKCQENPRMATRPYCPDCNRALQRHWYALRDKKPRSRGPEYKRYMKDYNLKAKYNLTIEEFEALAESQGGACAICGDEDKELHVDHDHESGRVRGLLCGWCNRGIGLLKEDKSILLMAVIYLEKT